MKVLTKKELKKHDYGLLLVSIQKKFKDITLCTTSEDDLQKWATALKDAALIGMSVLAHLTR